MTGAFQAASRLPAPSPEAAGAGRRPAELFNVNAHRAVQAQRQANLSRAEIMAG